MFPTRRFTAAAILLSLSLAPAAASAQDGRQWQTFLSDPEGGAGEAVLIFGTPQSDDVVIEATCGADHPGSVIIDLLVDFGPTDIGANTTAHFMIDGWQYSYRATTHDSEFVPYGRIAVELSDPLWPALLAGSEGEVSLFYAEPTAFALDTAAGSIAAFLHACGGA